MLPKQSGRTRRSGLGAFVAALALSLAPPLQAAFQDLYVSPRTAAMGGASLASWDDSTALFLNPAALTSLSAPESYFMYSQLYAGMAGVGAIGQGLITAGLPTKHGDFGVGLGDFRASNLLEERVLCLSYARQLFEGVSAGVTGKLFSHQYLTGSDPAAAQDPVFANGNGRSAAALDAGIVVSPAGPWQAALAIRNINQPDLGLATVDRVPREFQGGLAYTVKPLALRATADVTVRQDPAGSFQDNFLPALGLEKGFAADGLRLRLGVNTLQFSAGVGLQFGRLGFDYAFVLSRQLMSNNAGTHLLGLRWRFSDPGAAPATIATAPTAAPVAVTLSVPPVVTHDD